MGAVLCGVGERNGWENVKLEWSGVGGVEFEGKEGEKFKPSIPSILKMQTTMEARTSGGPLKNARAS
jgi:hypothetical protein